MVWRRYLPHVMDEAFLIVASGHLVSSVSRDRVRSIPVFEGGLSRVVGTPCSLRVNRVNLKMSDRGYPVEFFADITLFKDVEAVSGGRVRVNHPIVHDGYGIYIKAEMVQEVKVRPLGKGDRVAIVAPASPVDEKLLECGRTVLEAKGFLVEWTETILTRSGYLAGSDARRAEELNYFLAREDIRAIFVARGGYGTLRILDQIDFTALADHPRPIIGFSDTTALISYVSTRLEIPAIHACMPATEAVLKEDICHTNLLVRFLRDEISYPFVIYENLRSRGRGDPVRGKVFGGNLSVLCSLMGTPFEPDFAGRILFLEEVDEKAYRVDRKMTQLRLSGNLGKLSAVLMGRFVPVEGGDPALLEEIVAGECAAAGVPLFCGFPGGHEGENMPVPFGVTCEILTDKGRGTLTFLTSPFSG